MDATLLSLLACPGCRGSLEHLRENDKEGLACAACQVVYPVLDDIPVLLVEEGLSRSVWEARPAPDGKKDGS